MILRVVFTTLFIDSAINLLDFSIRYDTIKLSYTVVAKITKIILKVVLFV